MESLRATAKICPIRFLLQGKYITQEGWQPNYVQVGEQKISRVNIIALVVQKTRPNAFFVDDGTGSIQVIDFNQQKNVLSLAVGDPVLIIGRPRLHDDELFIAAEIVTSKQLIQEPHWLEKRQEELAQFSLKSEVVSEEVSLEKKEQQAVVSASDQLTGDDVVDFMRKKDTGEGVATEEITAYFGAEVEEVIHTLLSMGEVYEIRAGVLKVLE